MNRIDELVDLLKTKTKEEEKGKNTLLWVLAIVGAVAAVAGIAYAVYRFFTPDIWKILKMISTMISMTILRTRTKRSNGQNPWSKREAPVHDVHRGFFLGVPPLYKGEN